MNRLKSLREEARLTQGQLAKKLDVTPATISKYEKGDIALTDTLLKSLTSIFNVTSDYIIGISDVKKPENLPLSNILNLTESSINKLKLVTIDGVPENIWSESPLSTFEKMLATDEFPVLIYKLAQYLAVNDENYEKAAPFLQLINEKTNPQFLKDTKKSIILDLFSNMISSMENSDQ